MPPRKRARGESSAARIAAPNEAASVLQLPGFDDERLAALRSLYEAGECCDAEVVLRDRIFPVSRMSLCAASPFFRAVFAGGMREGAEQRVELDPTLSAQSVELLLEFAHAPGRAVETTELEEFVQAADQLGFASLLPICSDALVAATTSENAVSRMHLAYRHSLPSVLERGVQVLSDHADAVCRSPDFAALPQELVQTILSHEENAASESALYAGLLNWRAHDPQRHGAPYDALLEHIRFTELGMPFLISNVMHSEEILASGRARQLVQEAFSFLAADAAQRTALASPQTEPRGSFEFATFDETENIKVVKEERAVQLAPSTTPFGGSIRLRSALGSSVIRKPIQSWKVEVRLDQQERVHAHGPWAFVGVHHATAVSDEMLHDAVGFQHVTHDSYVHSIRACGQQTPPLSRGTAAWPGFEDGDIVTMTLDTSGASGTLTMAIPRLGGQKFKACGLDTTREYRLLIVFGPGSSQHLGSFRVMK